MRIFASPVSLSAAIFAALCSVSASASAQDATTPGTLTTPHPTLENISLKWEISGDDDQDGVVTVRYREAGTSPWRAGLPLRRIPPGSTEGFSWVNHHAGSIFYLQPDTSYEIELTLDDPDGGSAVETITVTTRPVPQAAAGSTELPVTPATFAAVASSAAPGDILLLADGTYPGFHFEHDGTADQPIVIRAENRGAAVVDGELSLIGRSYVFLEGLTVNDRIRLNNTVGMVVRECTVNTSGSGIVAQADGTVDSYICDNWVTGVTTWEDSSLGASGNNIGEGIQVTGAGTVICYNFVSGFRDAISTMEDSEAVDQVSIDIYNNDIEIGADDAIEADFTMGNVRVMHNRIRNSFVGMSGQPTLGGPTYFIRNVMHNVVYSPFKLHRGSVGDVAFHNTVVKCGDALGIYAGRTWSQALFRNNLFIGGEGGADWGGYSNGSGRVAQLADADDTCDFNFDGFGSIGTGTFSGRIGTTSFNSLAEMQSTTTETDAVEVDMSVFAQSITFPSSGPFPPLTDDDLRLADGSAAVDQGTPLANVNDGYVGAAPDLGAYEAGSLLPHYGPRGDGPSQECGNGVREGTEECDDANQVSGDGCSSDCMLEGAGGSGGTGTGGTGTGGTGTGGTGGTSPGGSAADSSDDGGCGCRAPARQLPAGSWWLGAGFAACTAARRRRRR